MKTRTSAAVLTCAALLLGCGAMPRSGTGTASTLVCGMSNTEANTCIVGLLRTVCHVYVAGTKDAPFVYPYKLNVPAGARNVVIVWTVLDRRASFRDRNDGPNLSANPEFSEGDTSDDADGASVSGQEARHFKFKFTNKALATPLPYSIKFKTDAGTPTECDPYISNSSN